MEKRAAHRFATDLEAECRSCNRSWSAQLRNISVTGCMILCPEPSLPDSALLRLRLKGLTAIDGQIVWQNRGHAGIRFNVPLHQALVEHLGFHEPEPESVPGASPMNPAPRSSRRPSSLHAQLVKRIWFNEALDKIAAIG